MKGNQKEKIGGISKKLGESEVFLNLRYEMLDSLPKEGTTPLKYGLSIGIDAALFLPYFADGAILYTHTTTGEAQAFPWKEAWDDLAWSPEVVRIMKEASALYKKNDLALENAALFTFGNVITCPKDAQGSVLLNTELKEDSRDMLYVIAEKGSDISIFDYVKEGNVRLSRNVIILAKESATVRYIHASNAGEANYTHTLAFVEKDAQVTCINATLPTRGVVKIDTELYLDGERAEGNLRNLSLSKGESVVDLYNVAHHRASHTTSSIHACGAAADTSKTMYRSDISMRGEKTIDTTGAQKARFLTLSKKAEIDAIPALDIAQKDVACSHSVSVSFLKDSDLYYPRLRGISREVAGTMIVEGMLQSQTMKVKNAQHAQQLTRMIEDALEELHF